jgi:hypothetical protein
MVAAAELPLLGTLPVLVEPILAEAQGHLVGLVLRVQGGKMPVLEVQERLLAPARCPPTGITGDRHLASAVAAVVHRHLVAAKETPQALDVRPAE